MKRILEGVKSSVVFKALLSEKPALSNGDLALAFRKQFPSIGIEAMEVIWKWRRPEMKMGLSDDGLDQQLAYWLQQTGYKVPG